MEKNDKRKNENKNKNNQIRTEKKQNKGKRKSNSENNRFHIANIRQSLSEQLVLRWVEIYKIRLYYEKRLLRSISSCCSFYY